MSRRVRPRVRNKSLTRNERTRRPKKKKKKLERTRTHASENTSPRTIGKRRRMPPGGAREEKQQQCGPRRRHPRRAPVCLHFRAGSFPSRHPRWRPSMEEGRRTRNLGEHPRETGETRAPATARAAAKGARRPFLRQLCCRRRRPLERVQPEDKAPVGSSTAAVPRKQLLLSFLHLLRLPFRR